ncbi:hypothetical protein KCP69_10100 [Salmonella enterica subsp. enterica]|nr:hypothetical protein KCP69_10100 [Salmonella enterica subsp. enterica]
MLRHRGLLYARSQTRRQRKSPGRDEAYRTMLLCSFWRVAGIPGVRRAVTLPQQNAIATVARSVSYHGRHRGPVRPLRWAFFKGTLVSGNLFDMKRLTSSCDGFAGLLGGGLNRLWAGDGESAHFCAFPAHIFRHSAKPRRREVESMIGSDGWLTVIGLCGWGGRDAICDQIMRGFCTRRHR